MAGVCEGAAPRRVGRFGMGESGGSARVKEVKADPEG